MVLSLNASVADVEQAFHVNLNLYPHPSESRAFYAPDREPTMDVDIPVLSVSGLDNFILPQPASLKRTPAPGSSGAVPLGGSGPHGEYLGNDFRGAYARGVNLTGTGQMVGLFEFDGFYASDITSYRITASIANIPIQTVLMDGFDGTPGINNVEVALDIETTISMAPGLAQVIVYEGVDTDSVLNRMATDNLAKQLSASWRYPTDATTLQIFRQFAAQGQSFFNASGDSGAYFSGDTRPTDDPYVILVGGTTLATTGKGGAWVSETTWNWASVGQATGGGVSTINKIPSYQQGISMTANQGSRTFRNTPDVAMVADGVYAVFDNGSIGSVGGTSCSAPLWAGFTALVNQQAASLAQPSVGFLNPAFYAIGKSAGYSTNFHDVATGNNTNASSPSLYFAVSGYDLCTGWGTPIGGNLINTLAPRAAAPVLTNSGQTLVTEGCTVPNGFIDPGETVTVNLTLKNIGGVKTTNLVATLVADAGVLLPSDPQTYGIVGASGGTLTRSFSFTANGACGANLVATLQLADGPTSLGTVPYTFPLGKPLSALSESFDGVSAPALPAIWSTSISSNGVAWVTSTAARDDGANSAFAAEPALPGVTELVSPQFSIDTTKALLSFRNNYNTEVDPLINDRAYDGGVLEIKIGTNNFTDVLVAGGTFVSGGYTRTLDATNDNPIAGRRVWSGNSGGFITSAVALPSNAAGQMIQLKWRFGTDTGNAEGGFGWYIDKVQVTDGAACCISSADLAVAQSATPNPAILGAQLDYQIKVNNLGPQTAYNVSVTDVLPPNATFLSAPPGCVYTNGSVICTPGTLASGSSTSFTISVLPVTGDPVTNLVSIASVTGDPSIDNNLATSITEVSANSLPLVTLEPLDAIVPAGSTALFEVAAAGPPPLAYQWFFNSEPMSGATSNSLVLPNVQSGNTGPYFAVIANPQGAVTSSIARLSLLVPPMIAVSGISMSSNHLAISLESSAGVTYSLEYKNSLDDNTWIALPPPLAGTGSQLVLQDTNRLAFPTRFYRVQAYQTP